MKALNISILLFLFPFSLFAQEGWFFQNPLPPGNELNSVFQIDQNNAWAVGNDGTILRTDSSGNWIAINANLTEDLYDVFFINNSTGWITGEYSLILKTTDGGQSWYNQLSDSTSNRQIYSIYFHNENDGVALSGIYVLNTTNGGSTWTIQEITNVLNRGCNRLFFLNSNLGWVSGTYNYIYKTTDGGLNWVEIPTPDQSIGSIFFVDSLKGFAVGNFQYVFKTIDGGMNWYNIDSTYGTRNLCFINQNIGWVVGRNGIIMKTTNGGTTWNNQSNGNRVAYESVSFIDENNGLAVGSSYMASRISKTTNGGINWTEEINFATPDDLNALAIIDTLNIISVGNYGDIVKTTDGGLNWFLTQEIEGYINDVDFINASTGWCVGERSSTDATPFIYNSIDGGFTWQLEPNSPLFSSKLSTIKFLNSDTGFVGGFSGQLLKTTDNGQNWSAYSETTCWDHFADFCFVDDSIGWAVGWYDGPDPNWDIIYKTTDNGNSWVSQESYYSGGLSAVFFIDKNIGWGVGGKGVVSTINGGENWYIHPTVTHSLYSVYFVSENIGWAVGANGLIIKTTNGGEDWWQQKSRTNRYLYDIKFVDDSIGFIVGADGIILKTVDGGGKLFPIPVGVIEPTKLNSLNNYYLSQNYPNPFNPVTSFQYTVGSTRFVTIKVYDILGREITTLVNEEKPAGEYKVEFNASNLPSGIYFYQLKSGNYVQTKKMILLK